MNTELRKRLEEAAEEYAVERIGNQHPFISEYRRRILTIHDNFALEEAFADGAKLGYKEAIKVAKEWLDEHGKLDKLDLVEFDMEMFRLWKEKK